MNEELIKAMAELRGGKKKLRELREGVQARFEHASASMDNWMRKAEELHNTLDLIDKLAVREPNGKPDSNEEAS